MHCYSYFVHRAMARKLTFALAASFQDYSKRVKEAEEKNGGSGCDTEKSLRKKFAIDLRTPEEMQQDITEQETEAWLKVEVAPHSNNNNNQQNIHTGPTWVQILVLVC